MPFFAVLVELDDLKGLGHVILGNFKEFQHRSNRHRINLNIKITAPNYRRTLTKNREAKKGHGWTKPERTEMDCIWVNLKKVSPPVSYT